MMYLELACIVTLYTAGVAACLGWRRAAKAQDEAVHRLNVVTSERDDAEREKRRLQEMCSEYAGQIGAACEERDAYRSENEKLRRAKERNAWN